MHSDLIEQLETTLNAGDIVRRADVLRRVTDLFVLGSGRFSEQQVELFDDVMGQLVNKIETGARAQFGSRIAILPDAPRNIVRTLASDDSIEVAGPVLVASERLDDHTLLETAMTRSQDHLLAISHRKELVEAVTDVLVERGNQAVVSSTAKNSGARFSEFGVSTLVARAASDSDLARKIWTRSDIPRQNLVQLFMQASEDLKEQLGSTDPRKAELIRSAVAEASDQIQTSARAGSGEFASALSHVKALHAAGKLDEAQLMAFARQGNFDRTTVSLSLMCDLPFGLVERVLVQAQTQQVLVLAKAINLSWETAKTLLLLHAGVNGSSREQLDQCMQSYLRLQPKTAQTALQFYRMREKANRKPTRV